MTMIALLRAFVVETMERKRRASSKLGFAQLDYGRLFIRDQWTLFAIARELGCTVEELIAPIEPQRESRVAWSEIVDASESLMASVRSLRDPIKQVILLKASGMSMRKIAVALPGRASFSLAEDLEEGARKTWILASHEVRFLAHVEHPKFAITRLKPRSC
jgi:hypothetical protein